MPAQTLIDVLAPVSHAELRWSEFDACAQLCKDIGHENLWCRTHSLPCIPTEEYAKMMNDYAELHCSARSAPEVSKIGLACEAERKFPQTSCVFVDRRTLPQFKHLNPASPDFDRYDAHLVSTMEHECG